MVRSDDLGHPEAEAALARMLELPLRSFAEAELLPAAWPLRQVARIADAFYLAAAQAAQAPLLTTDGRLARGHHGIPVMLVE